jgi:hypothetical protein
MHVALLTKQLQPRLWNLTNHALLSVLRTGRGIRCQKNARPVFFDRFSLRSPTASPAAALDTVRGVGATAKLTARHRATRVLTRDES